MPRVVPDAVQQTGLAFHHPVEAHEVQTGYPIIVKGPGARRRCCLEEAGVTCCKAAAGTARRVPMECGARRRLYASDSGN